MLFFMCYYMEQIVHWTKATKNWEWNGGFYIFIVFCCCFFPSRLCNQRRDRSGVTIICSLNKSNEELRMKRWFLYFHTLFLFFKIMQSKKREIWSYHHLSIEQKQRRTENETVIFIFSYSFSFFQDYAIKEEIDLELLPFVFGGPK